MTDPETHRECHVEKVKHALLGLSATGGVMATILAAHDSWFAVVPLAAGLWAALNLINIAGQETDEKVAGKEGQNAE